MPASAGKRAAQEYSRLLTGIFEIMLACGLSRREVLSAASTALKRAKEYPGNKRKDLPGHLANAALVLDAWHRDRRYLTVKAEPRAVPLLGPAPSVEALIRAQPGNRNALAVAEKLKAQRFLIKTTRDLYKPTSNIALLSRFDPLAVQHVARSLSMLLETIRQNLDVENPNQRLIERIAEVPDLPIEHVQDFRKFTQRQGWILLRTVNDWLEVRRARSTKRVRKSVRAGMHLNAYIAKPTSQTSSNSKTRS